MNNQCGIIGEGRDMKTKRRNIAVFIAAVFILTSLQLWGFRAVAKSAKPSFSKIKESSGLVKITRPDGTTVNVSPGEVSPLIPSGSLIEVATGTAKIEIWGIIVNLKAVSSVKISIDKKTGKINISTIEGKATIVIGKTVAIVEKGEEIAIGVERRTGRPDIEAIKGTIDIYYAGRLTTLGAGKTFQVEMRTFREEPPEPEPIAASPYSPD